MSDVDEGAAKLFEGVSRGQQRKSWEEVLNKIDKMSGGSEIKRDEQIILPQKNNKELKK